MDGTTDTFKNVIHYNVTGIGVLAILTGAAVMAVAALGFWTSLFRSWGGLIVVHAIQINRDKIVKRL